MKPLADIIENREQLLEFLERLRRSLIQMAVVVFALALAGYALAREVLSFLQRHTGVTLAYYALTETFFALLHIALALSLIVSLPFILYKVLAALQAVVPPFTRKMFYGFWFGFVLLFYLGAGFCLLVTLPYGVKFLLGFQNQSLEALISVRRFISFSLTFIFAFGIVFELPLIMIFLGRLGLVPHTVFTRYRRYALLIIVTLSAVLTPTPDAFNMMLMAVPLYILYEFGILGMRLWGKKASAG